MTPHDQLDCRTIPAAAPPHLENPFAARVSLPADEMRRLGYRAVDLLVEYSTRMPTESPRGEMPVEEVAAWGARQPSRHGQPWESVLDELVGSVLADRLKLDHPRVFSHIPSPGNFVGAVADFLASGMNVFNGTWQQSRGPMLLETSLMRWMASAVGLPDGASGLVTTGGSEGNFLALASALGRVPKGRKPTVYWSDQAHHSLDKAARILRLGPDSVRRVRTDSNGVMLPSHLRELANRDVGEGRVPVLIAGTAGTTNTGAIDPLAELAEVSAELDAHFHVDAAINGALALFRHPGAGNPGLEMADSIVIDPHKWLFQPYEVGCLLVRDHRSLSRTFSVSAPYVEPMREDLSPDFISLGVQQSRAFRALKIWLTLEVFGLEELEAAVIHGLHLASRCRRRLLETGRWELIGSVQSPVVACRFVPDAEHSPVQVDEINRRIVEKLNASGVAFVGTSTFKQRTLVRLCPINPRTSDEDIDQTIAAMCSVAEEVGGNAERARRIAS
jgi:aromatic-L-amino-acid/L-tryptophan decarboxylase